jgi:hypothetical protein
MTYSYNQRAASMTPTTFSGAIDQQQQHEQISDMNREVGVSEMTSIRKLLWKFLRKGDLESVSKIFEGAFAKISDHSRLETSQLENPPSTDEEGDVSGKGTNFHSEETNNQQELNSEIVVGRRS